MGKISERINHCKISSGYCRICGKEGKLSADHVPPKGSINLTATEQKSIIEFTSNANLQGVKSTKGSVFRTICKQCNSNLGLFDMEIKRVTDELGRKVKHHFGSYSNPYNYVSVKLNAKSYLKGIVGHILSSTSSKSCLQPILDSEFYTPLREFVIGKRESLDDKYNFYYWFYPHRFNVSGSGFGLGVFGTNGTVIGGVLYFFPVAIFIGTKEGIIPQLEARNKLRISDEKMFLNLSSEFFHESAFPFMSLKGMTVLILNDNEVTASYPIHNN